MRGLKSHTTPAQPVGVFLIKMEFKLTGTEEETTRAWQSVHTAECPHMIANRDEPFKGIPATGGRWWYRFTPTGVGTCVTVGCSFCGAFKDVTDVESW